LERGHLTRVERFCPVAAVYDRRPRTTAVIDRRYRPACILRLMTKRPCEADRPWILRSAQDDATKCRREACRLDETGNPVLNLTADR
jgi:hypothetical protein